MKLKRLKVNTKSRILIITVSICVATLLIILVISNYMRIGNLTIPFFHKDISIDKPFSQGSEGYTSKDYNDLVNIKGVKTIYRLMQNNELILLDDNQISTEFKNFYKNKNLPIIDGGGATYPVIAANLYGYRNEDLVLYKKKLISGKMMQHKWIVKMEY